MTGLNELNRKYQTRYGRGNYLPPVESIYWSMRGMAYAGSLVALVAVLGAFLYWRRRLERRRWFLWSAVAATVLPFVAAIFGWCLTELGRQPWIVQGLLQDEGCQLAQRQHDLDRDQPRGLRLPSTCRCSSSTSG